MKNTTNYLIISIIVIIFLSFSSCKKDDYTNPKNLSGTEWKSAIVHEAGIYYLLKFTGKSSYELREYEPQLDKLEVYQRGSYSMDGNNIEFNPDDDDYTDRGVINGQTLTFFDLYDGDIVFAIQ